MTTANPTLLQSLNQFGVDLAFWDLANAQDITEIEANLQALALTPELPSAMAQALALALVQLPVWSATAQSDPSAAMALLCQWYSQTELLFTQGPGPLVATVSTVTPAACPTLVQTSPKSWPQSGPSATPKTPKACAAQAGVFSS